MSCETCASISTLMNIARPPLTLPLWSLMDVEIGISQSDPVIVIGNVMYTVHTSNNDAEHYRTQKWLTNNYMTVALSA